ncbi:hypothetical protein AOG2_26040 [Geobacter sp. AOG2]|nr:hypothetical protein AOG2_26040 [Geobacter sp. AOG2]
MGHYSLSHLESQPRKVGVGRRRGGQLRGRGTELGARGTGRFYKSITNTQSDPLYDKRQDV